LVGVLGIANYRIEIDDSIEVAASANPLIHCLAVGFTERAGMIVARADVRSDGCAIDAQPVCVGTVNNLPIRRKDALDQSRVFRGWDFTIAGQATEIVHSLENDQPMHTRGGKHVAIEAREDVWPQAVGQKVIASYALVGNADIARGGRGLKAGGEYVGPTVIAVGGGAVSVGDGVAESDD
jgi:hypothetical protein